MAIVDRLAVLDERNQDQQDYLDTLTELVDKYDDDHNARDCSGITPIESVKYLCEQNGTNASALGNLLGNRSLGSKILRGERALSKEHIRKLCAHFAVSADLFI